MTILQILKFPDKRLRNVAKPIEKIDDILKAQIKDMYETMYDANGVGLAATQVNIAKRVFVMDLTETQDQPFCFINPEIVHQEGIQYETEACLSVGGGAYDRVERAAKVTLKALDIDGNAIEMQGEELMAKCFQHEMDHLNGILFIDHLSKLKQDVIKKKIAKEQKHA